MLSRDCDGCSQIRACKKRYTRVVKGERVYCPDGTPHLADESTIFQNIELNQQNIELAQQH